MQSSKNGLSRDLRKRELFSQFASQLETGLSPEAEKAEAETNPFYLLENEKLWIKTKAAELIPLELNHDQKLLLGVVKKLAALKKAIRIWILKARQKGVSTFCEGIIYSMTSQNQNINSLILADDIDGSNYLFEMSKLYQEKLEENHPHLAPALKKSNEKKLEFADIHSQIRIDSAMNARSAMTGGSRVGRKFTFQIVHLSEVAYFPGLKSLLTGLLQAVPKLPGTIVVGETTANGLGGDFYEEWQRAKRGESDWYPLFIPWFTSPEYSMALEPDEILQLDSEEKSLLKLFRSYKLDPAKDMARLKWRRHTIANECQGSLDIFHQEYPSTDVEAFISSGRPVFNTKVLHEWLNAATDPIATGDLHSEDVLEQPSFVDNDQGFVKVWEWPEEGKQYAIGVDVAEGLEKGDYSTGQVICRDTLKLVAEWHGHIEEHLLADEMAKLGMFYNEAYISVEVNAMGISTCRFLQEMPYSMVYYRKQFDKVAHQYVDRVGWKTDRVSRPVLIAGIAKFITNYEGEIPSKELIGEMFSFVRDAQGKAEAQEGCFDDRVMAFGIALQLHDSEPLLYFEEEREKTLQEKIQDIVTGKMDEGEIDDLFVTEDQGAWRDNF